MKTGAYSVCYALISNMAILLCYIPFLSLSWKKIREVKTYWFIAIYWLLNGLINLQGINLFHLQLTSYWQGKLGLGFVLIQTPLVLLSFAFATTGRTRSQLRLLFLLFIVWEAALMGWKGYTNSTRLLLMGSGLLLTLGYCIAGLFQYVKNMEHTRFENSMVFIYAAFLFAYCSFLIIAAFAHLHSNGFNSGTDSFLLYYISQLIAAAVTITGLWNFGRGTMRRTPVNRLAAYSSSSS